MRRLNVNILLSFLHGYSDWTLSKKFGGYVLKFETETGLKRRITKFNPPKIKPHVSSKSSVPVKKNSKKAPEPQKMTTTESRVNVKGRARFNSGGGSSEADSLSWDDYDVIASKRKGGEALEEVETSSVSSSCISSKESSPEMHREGKLLLMEMKELRKEIKKMGDTSVLDNNYSREVTLLPTDYSIEELQEMMVKMEEEDRCWDSGYNDDKEFSSDKEQEEEGRFQEVTPERILEDEEEEVPFDLEEVHSSIEEEGNVSGTESLGSAIVVELSESSKNLSQFIEPIAPPISKTQKKRLRRQRAKLRHKATNRYTAPIADAARESCRSRWSPCESARLAQLCANTPSPDKEIVAGIDSILGRETINKDLTPTPIIKGRTVIYKNLFAWEVSFCDTKERYKELLNKKYEEDQLKLQSILEESFAAKKSLGRSITVC